MRSDPIHNPRERSPGRHRVTVRAFLTGCLFLVLVALVNFYVELAWGINWAGSWMFSSGAPAALPVVVLFVLASAMAPS